AVLVAWVGWKIRSVINPLILGYLLAFILQPAVESLQRRGMKRSGAVISVFGLAFVLTGVIGLAVAIQARGFVGQFVEQAKQSNVTAVEIIEEVVPRPEGVQPGPEQASSGPEGSEPSGEAAAEGAVEAEQDGERSQLLAMIGERLGEDWAARAEELGLGDQGAIQSLSDTAFSWLGVVLATLQSFFGGVVGLVTLLVMVPVYAFFWLFEMQRLNEYIVEHLPVRHRERLVDLSSRLGQVLSVFFRGRLTVCLLKGLFLTAGLLLTGIPYALLLGVGGGFLSIIPFLGGIVAFLAALVVALANHSLLYALLASGIVFGLAELLEGYVLMPRVLGESLGLTDVTVLFAITAGGALLGLFGVLIALPLAAAIKILYHEFVEPALEQFVEEDADPTASGG
ncbi:MAG: AI-2E family transporter, partial [Planctomycetota bacterium]